VLICLSRSEASKAEVKRTAEAIPPIEPSPQTAQDAPSEDSAEKEFRAGRLWEEGDQLISDKKWEEGAAKLGDSLELMYVQFSSFLSFSSP
jgi:hypothetical protein